MRFLLILCLCFFFNFSISAQSTQTTYTNMSLQELKSIDASSLSKADKKLYKKALKAAKKAEKKLRKQQRKEQKKNNKRVQAQLELIDIIRSNVSYYKGEFDAQGQFSGPRYPQNKKALAIFMTPLRDMWDYELLTEVKDHGEYTIYAKISLSAARIADEYSYEVPNYYNELMRQANLYDYWDNYNKAVLPGGKAVPLQTGRKYLSQCTQNRCDFREDVYIDLTSDILDDVLDYLKAPRFKISSTSAGVYYVVTLEPAYIIGYLIGLGEGFPPAEALKARAEAAAQLLASRLHPIADQK